MNILETTKDLAGKTRVVIDTDTKAIMLKFDKTPTDEEVIKEAEKAVARQEELRAERHTEIDEEIAHLQEEKELL